MALAKGAAVVVARGRAGVASQPVHTYVRSTYLSVRKRCNASTTTAVYMLAPLFAYGNLLLSI